MRAEIAISVQR